jgi:hypothetical protein
LQRSGFVDAENSGMGMGAAQERGMQQTGNTYVVDKAPLARQETLIFNPAMT